MPNLQTGSNVLVAFKKETTMGVPAGAASGTQLRLVPSQGLELKRAAILSNERRTDAQKTMGRLGFKTVDGGYSCELSLASFDALFEGIMRSTFAAVLAGTQTDFTSVTTGANSIIAASGSFITKGYRVGDVVQLTGFPDAANNGKNIRITSVTASTLGTAETLIVNAVADTTFTITRTKKLTNGAVPVRTSFTVEEYYQDLDLTELFLGCRLIGMKLSCKPGANVTVQLTFMGLDHQILATGTSPYFTTPVLTTSIGMIADDSTIRFGGADIATFTGFDLDITIAAKGEAVIASLISPDVFDNDATVSGTITALRSDLAALTAYDAETEFETQILLVENESEPKDFISIFIPRSKYQNVSKQNFAGDGALTVSLPLMVGKKEGVVGYDSTTLAIQTSAP